MVSSAVPPSALSRVIGYALEYRDLQTGASVLPVRILVLSDISDTSAAQSGDKILNATADKVADKLGRSSLGCEIMNTLDGLNASQFIDVLAVDPELPSLDLRATLNTALGDVWYNIVVNPFALSPDGNYDAVSAKFYAVLASVNGAPSDTGGTGRWNAITVKPFVAISGTNLEIFEPLPSNDLTNIIGTAPKAFADSPIFTQASAFRIISARIAAAYAFLAYKQFSARPHLDIAGQILPEIEPPADLNTRIFETHDQRDTIAKQGICTVNIDRAARGYVVQDFITPYRPSAQGELAKSWRFVRDIFVDFNVAFNYNILQARRLLGKVIISDSDIIPAHLEKDAVRLSVWKAEVLIFLSNMISLLYMTDIDFARENLFVELSSDNPRRINTQFSYKRTSTVNIASTTAYVGFSFGGTQ